MRIGHTLFGGAVAGLVFASGVAVCAASASAENNVTKHFESQAQATSTASGYGLRDAGNFPSLASCKANAYGAPIADYRPLPVEIIGSATATGRSTAEFFTYSFGNASAIMSGSPLRTVKLYPRQAQAKAYGQGDGQSWQLGYAKPAICRATGFGTTYYVGDGPGSAHASIAGYPALEIGATGYGDASSSASAVALFTIGAAGVGEAPAIALGDASVTRNGLRELEANGIGQCSAVASAGTVGIHQAQTGKAFANIVGYPKVQTGGKGHGKAFAIGEADGIGMSTGASAVVGETSATATGDAHYQANAFSHSLATATAVGNGVASQTRVKGKVGNGTAIAAGESLRTACAYAFAASYAAAKSIKQTKTISAGKSKARATAVTSTGPVALFVRGEVANAKATTKALSVKKLFAQGQANATAQGQGYNQINDLQRAPERRTHKVAPAVRLILIGESQRLIAV